MIDHELEDRIDEIGRERVFALLEANGWKRGAPGIPKWVWREACHEVLKKLNESEPRSTVAPWTRKTVVCSFVR